jgi:hypothetical protein
MEVTDSRAANCLGMRLLVSATHEPFRCKQALLARRNNMLLDSAAHLARLGARGGGEPKAASISCHQFSNAPNGRLEGALRFSFL